MLEAMNTAHRELAIRTAYEVDLSPGFRADESRFAPFKTASLAVRVRVPTVLHQARAALVHDTSRRLTELSAPTLVLHGTADEMIDVVNADYIAELGPSSHRVSRKRTLELLDGLGHLFWWERPVAIAELVRNHCLGGRQVSQVAGVGAQQ